MQQGKFSNNIPLYQISLISIQRKKLHSNAVLPLQALSQKKIHEFPDGVSIFPRLTALRYVLLTGVDVIF